MKRIISKYKRELQNIFGLLRKKNGPRITTNLKRTNMDKTGKKKRSLRRIRKVELDKKKLNFHDKPDNENIAGQKAFKLSSLMTLLGCLKAMFRLPLWFD